MRNSFRAYYAPAGQELEGIWSDGTIVLDTNTLLNFFRYTPSTRDEFLRVLESLSSSLWIPYQVGLEFQRRRLDVISATSEAFSKIKDSVVTAKNTVAKSLNEYKHHPSLNRAEIIAELEGLFRVFSEKMDDRERGHEEWISGAGDPDRTFARISDLFSERVGEPFSAEERAAIEVEGETRYEKKIPPGYKDSGKTNGNQFGDLIIWKEILRFGAVNNQPLIFVTDDAKEDWWRIERGKTQGPRVELIDEYWEASGKRIHFYEPLQFLRFAKERTQIPVSNDSLEEVEEVSNANERALRVLRERRDRLQRQRHSQIRSIERRRNESLDSDQRDALRNEYEAVTREHREIELQREVGGAETETLLKRLGEFRDGVGREEEIHRITARLAHKAELDDRAESLARRRMDLERQLRRSPREDSQMTDMWMRRLHAIDEELRDVSLALDELES